MSTALLSAPDERQFSLFQTKPELSKQSSVYLSAATSGRRYAPTGRAPYAPRAMLGLILYGIMQGVSSIRALERLARVDLHPMLLN